MKYQRALVLIVLILLFFVSNNYAGKLIEHQEIASKIELLETWITAQMEWRNLPGLSIAIVYDQELVWSKGFGYSNVDKKIPATSHTIYRIASITKLFTSTAIMQLRDQGKLQLDDPITKFLPWFNIKHRFPDAPEITIWNLLTHTSGLPREAAFPYWTDSKFPTLEQIINTLPDQETIFPAESKYKYSNLGMALLGEIVVAASGEPYDQYIHKHILNPLEMISSSVHLPTEHKKRLTAAYGRQMPDGSRELISYKDTKGITPAANISSTVDDLSRFAMLQFRDGKAGGNQILKRSTLQEMHRVQWLRPSWSGGRGLGFGVWKQGDRVFVGHSGWVGGNRSQLLFCPDEKIAVIVMINAEDGTPYLYANRAYHMLAPEIIKAVTPAAQKKQFDPAWNKYVGMYTDPWGWDTEIMILDDGLVMYSYNYPPEDDPEGPVVQLTPEGEHTFRMSGENGNGELVIFDFDKNGKIVHVKTGENFIYPKK